MIMFAVSPRLLVISLQVKNISSLFKLEASSVYLVEEIDNMVLFPLENGEFKSSHVFPSSTYEVHGNAAVTPELSSTSMSLPVTSGINIPYGGYTSPTFQSNSTPPPHLPCTSKNSNKIKKTIVLVNVSKKAKGKEKLGTGKVDYTAITQVVVSMTAVQCNVPTISKLVEQQVGFEVMLLDSKCFPLLSNDSTCGPDFWKGTRKILAASKSVYQKLTGLSTDLNAIDLTIEEAGPSEKKPRLESDDSMKIVLKKLTKVESQLGFLEQLAQAFQCVICKSISKTPVIFPCCQRIIGCETCVNTWLTANERCPFCSTSTSVSKRFCIKGFDDALGLIEATIPGDEKTNSEIPDNVSAPPSNFPDSDSDFDLP